MKTIKWLVSLVPPSSRALFACLLIAVMSLTTVVVRQDNKITEIQTLYRSDLNAVNSVYVKKVDSLNKVILIIKDDSKQEALNSLERIITNQKSIIEDQKKQAQKKGKVNENTLINGTYKTNKKLKPE